MSAIRKIYSEVTDSNQQQTGSGKIGGNMDITLLCPFSCPFQPSNTSMAGLAKSLPQLQTLHAQELESRQISSALSKSKAYLCATKGCSVLEYIVINGG